MASRLSDEDILQLAPLLGSLARFITRGSRLSENELKVLLLGTDISYTPTIFQELLLWEQLLKTLHEQPFAEMRSVTVEALLLRGLPEANVLLAVDAVTKGNTPTAKVAGVTHQHLQVHPTQLDFGMLQEGLSSTQELVIEGGPGRILVESDQIHVIPSNFGSGTTRVRISVKPVHDSLLWTTLKIVTQSESVDIPVLAQWASTLTTTFTVQQSPAYPQPVQPVRTTQPPIASSPPLADIAAMINDEFSATPKTGSSPRPHTQPQNPSGEEDILDQIQKLL